MKTFVVTLLCIGMLLPPVPASSTKDPGGEPGRSSSCGHARALEEAKRALAEGDREDALQHLQRARALLTACERKAVSPEPPGGESGPASRTFARPASAGPDRPFIPSVSGASRPG
jgi:hypothetical protein